MRGPFRGVFPYPLSWLNDGAQEIAASIGRWADEELIAHRLEHREDLEHQMQALTVLCRTLGLDTFVWSPAEEGFVFPAVSSTLVRVDEEVARGDPGVAFISAMKTALIAALTQEGLLGAAVRSVLQPVFEQTPPGLIALVLPGLGDTGRHPGTLVWGRELCAGVLRQGETWVLNARGVRPLNSGYNAGLYAIVATLEEGLCLARVPATSPGLKRGAALKTTGLHASRNADIDLVDVSLPDAQVIPLDPQAHGRLLTWIDLFIGAIAVGSAMDVFRIVGNWAENRIIKTGGLLKDNPMDAAVLAQVAMDIMNTRLLVHSLARAVAHPEEFGLEDAHLLFILSESIVFQVAQQCMHAVDRTMELMGSAGYAKEWNVEKHWRDIRTLMVTLGGRVPLEMDVARAFYGSEGL